MPQANEKSGIQALASARPGLLIERGRAGRLPHDYRRNGAMTLFAALNVLDGPGIGKRVPRRRHTEFACFLRRVALELLTRLPIHMILGSCATHQHDKVELCFGKHLSFHSHSIPTSSSWLNLAEGRLRDLDDRVICRVAFHPFPS